MREVIEGGEVDGADGRQRENALSKLGEERESPFSQCQMYAELSKQFFNLF